MILNFLTPPILGFVATQLFLLISFLVLAELSRVLGQALKKIRFYRLFYVSIAFVIAALIVRFIPGSSSSLVYTLNLLSLAPGSLVAIYYWYWIIPELRN